MKDELPQDPAPAPAKRAYDKPAVTELGDVRALTLGGAGTKGDAKGFRRN